MAHEIASESAHGSRAAAPRCPWNAPRGSRSPPDSNGAILRRDWRANATGDKRVGGRRPELSGPGERQAELMFEQLETAPADPILGLTEAFKADPNPDKINLGVGVYQDEAGRTPILDCVRRAEKRLLDEETTKAYLSIEGSVAFGQAVRGLLFGGDGAALAERGVTAQTPGGTGAVRVAADFIKALRPNASVWLSDPTWPNHPGLFGAARLETRAYPYFDHETNGLKWPALLNALAGVPQGDIVVLHGSCHNPTGIDPNEEQWRAIARVLRERGIVPLIDFAYQGLGDGLTQDATGVRALARELPELLICSSFSKNFGLYKERVGALTLLAESPDRAKRALSHLRLVIRTNYSNPPAHGGAVVTLVLTDPELRRQWEAEVLVMRERIQRMRQLFVRDLARKGVQRDFSFLLRQKGMFSFSGLTKAEVEWLRRVHAVYMVDSGRINVAGMNESNMDRLTSAVAAALEARSRA